jgi:hypothetical protein
VGLSKIKPEAGENVALQSVDSEPMRDENGRQFFPSLGILSGNRDPVLLNRKF